METIDSLARAINSWDGGMVLVSHDFRLISQVRSCAGALCPKATSVPARHACGAVSRICLPWGIALPAASGVTPVQAQGSLVENAAGWWVMRCRHISQPPLMADSGMQVAEEIWVVGDNTVAKWSGTIAEYKEHLKATHAALVDSKPEMTER